MPLKKSNRILFVLAVLAAIFNSVIPAHAQVASAWKKTGAPSGVNWASIASSADGNRLLAVISDGTVCLSTNSGDTWTTNNLSVPAVNYGHTAACSTNGNVLVVASYLGGIMVSTNSGATWVSHGSALNYSAVACSGDGTKMVACVSGDNGPINPYGGYIYTSTDTGASWTQRATLRPWTCVASSADGTQLVATAGGITNGYPCYDYIYSSSNSGVTWAQAFAAFNNYSSIASSADGSVKIASTYHDRSPPPDYINPGLAGYIYKFFHDEEFGDSWSFPGGTTSPSMQYNAVTVSGDGSREVVAGESLNGGPPGVIYTSTDNFNWQLMYAPDSSWSCVASSADGKKLAACSRLGGAVYTYVVPDSTAPTMNISMGGGNAYLSWPWPSTGYILQQTTNVAVSNWVNVSTAPAVVNQVIAPATNNQNFYRLVKP